MSHDSLDTERLKLCRTIALRCARSLHCSECDCEDFSQEFAIHVFEAYRKAADAPPPEHQGALLARMARYDCIDFIRSLSRKRSLEGISLQRVEPAGEEWGLAVTDSSSDPATIVTQRALKAAILAAIESLHGAPREILALYYIKGMSSAEISNCTGRTTNAIKQCLCASRPMICARMAKEGWSASDALEVTDLCTPRVPRIVTAPRGDED